MVHYDTLEIQLASDLLLEIAFHGHPALTEAEREIMSIGHSLLKKLLSQQTALDFDGFKAAPLEAAN